MNGLYNTIVFLFLQNKNIFSKWRESSYVSLCHPQLKGRTVTVAWAWRTQGVDMNIINTDAITVYCQVSVPPVRHESLSHPLLCLCWAPLARARRVGRDPRYLYHFYTIWGLLLIGLFTLYFSPQIEWNMLSWERWNQACRCCHQPPQQQRNVNCWQWSVYFLVSAANNTLIIANIDIWCWTEESFVL